MNIKKEYKKILLNTGYFRDSKHLENYINLVVHLQLKNPMKLKDMYVHHVCPKWICRKLNLNDDWNHINTVYVTSKQHQALHNLLIATAIDLDTASHFRGCGNIKWDTVKNKYPPNFPQKIKKEIQPLIFKIYTK